MKRPRLLAAAMAVPLFGAISAVAVPAATAQPALAGPATEFTVLAKDVGSIATAQQAIRAAGGTVLETNSAVGLIKASAPATGFTERVSANRAVFGAAKSQVIGSLPKNGKKAKNDNAEKEGRGTAASCAPLERRDFARVLHRLSDDRAQRAARYQSAVRRRTPRREPHSRRAVRGAVQP